MTAEAISTYTDEDFLEEVFIEADDLQKLKYLLSKKRNIILQGAPGTGNYDKLWIMLRNGLPPQVTRLQQPCPFA